MQQQPTQTDRTELFNAPFLRRVEHLALLARRMATSGQRGQRRSKKVGGGIEFADHRDYAPGDDPRRLDWKVYGRTERLLLRQCEEEEDLSVYFLLDCSTSMSMAPPGTRTLFERALQVTAALSYISLSNLDRVAVVPFSTTIGRPARSLRSKGQFFRILRQLSALQCSGQTEICDALKAFARHRPRRGLVVLISDFYDSRGVDDGLRYLHYRGYESMVLQLTDKRILDAEHWGDLVLVDCESGQTRELCLTPELMKAYTQEFEAFSGRIADGAREVGARYLQVDVGQRFDEIVMKVFRSGGFLG